MGKWKDKTLEWEAEQQARDGRIDLRKLWNKSLTKKTMNDETTPVEETEVKVEPTETQPEQPEQEATQAAE